jgi:hypothetical protein
VRQNRLVLHHTSQSPHPAAMADTDVNSTTLSPCVVPSLPWQSSAALCSNGDDTMSKHTLYRVRL